MHLKHKRSSSGDASYFHGYRSASIGPGGSIGTGTGITGTGTGAAVHSKTAPRSMSMSMSTAGGSGGGSSGGNFNMSLRGLFGGGGGGGPHAGGGRERRGSGDLTTRRRSGSGDFPIMTQMRRSGSGDFTTRRRSNSSDLARHHRRSGSGDFNKSLSLEEAILGAEVAAAEAAAFHADSHASSFHKTPDRGGRRKVSLSSPTAMAALALPHLAAGGHEEDLKTSDTEKDNKTSIDDHHQRGSSHSSGLSAATAVAQLFFPAGDRKKKRQQQADKQWSSIFNRSFGDDSIPENSVAPQDFGGQHGEHEDDPYGDPYEHGHEHEGGDDMDDEAQRGESGSSSSVVRVPESRLRNIYDKINSMRADHDMEIRRQDIAVDALVSENATLKKRLETLLSDADDRHTVSEYAKLITESMPPPHVVDSTYVLKLQSQLCRALHKMGMLENQLELAENTEGDRVKELQSKLAERGDESFRSEVEHMNDLLSMEREMEAKRLESERMLEEKEKELEKLRAELDREREGHRRTLESFAPAHPYYSSSHSSTSLDRVISEEKKIDVGSHPPPVPSGLLNHNDPASPFMENRAA